MEDVDALRKHARQEKIDAFLLGVASMLIVGLLLHFLNVNLLQMGMGMIIGNGATTVIGNHYNAQVLNSSNNSIGTNPAMMQTPPDSGTMHL